MDGDVVTPEIIAGIQRVLEVKHDQEADTLDVLSAEFNLVAILNASFPDEASLAQLEDVQARLVQDECDLRQEIDLLKSQLKENQDPGRMHLIQEMISDLLGQMSRIREKATESEAVVRNITKDIQVLDLAKKNLILSMTTLKRLQMLVNALTQLEDLVKEKRYSDIAQTLAAVKQISSSFKSYLSVPRISQLWKRTQELQGELRSMIDNDFDTFYMQDPSKPIKSSVIYDACLVADVLGDDARSHMIDRYVGLELKEYRRIFRVTDEAGQLDNISRRFAWFRRLLQTHEVEQGRVFPTDWKVGWHLLAKFTEITRDDLTSLLSKAGSSLTVKVLLDNIQLTKDFEISMEKKWTTPLQDILNAASMIGSRPSQSISSAFEPHMGVFVDAQDKVLADMLAPHRKGKKTQSRASLESENETASLPAVILPSSTELFYFYGQSLEQCAKLSTGQPLFDLCNVHKKWLRIYAEDVLVARLKKPASQTRRSTDTRFDPGEVQQACQSINTAEYCQTTAAELEEKIREKVKIEFKEKITLQEERDLFMRVISTAIVILLREFEAACDPSLAALARTSWPTLNQVTGPSLYTNDLVKSTEQVVEVIKPWIEQKKYLRNILDKICSLILTKFTNALVKSRPLGEIGAEQLLIDLQSIKAYLIKMPGEALTTTSYTRGLAKNTTQLEALLKVIVTPADPSEGFILNYTLLIGDASFSNFQKILDLKGTPKAEQHGLLDSFVALTSTKQELESTSFLSSLDMDPFTTSTPADLASPGGKVSLPLTTNTGGDGILSGLISPPLSGPPTGSSVADGKLGDQKQVFPDFRRFVSFGRRKDTQGP